ncbi:hypothetical protein RhiJN_08943 [Ceratobasidium sp. AG-Ba]|nr:hypothetical protein RhiJN_08943 [Ceratobasidium sp. AG-Ba]QRW09732.1 hypothetical protein RhiLY_08731 [Ceratobasidium sp. AG-Ba]
MNALRTIGCRSHDLIQWFPRRDLASSASSSELLAKIDFGYDFDIMDVLAVCFTVQNHSACGVYTLQRYNCYFLCLTILAVLARRRAGWEGMDNETWNSCITGAIGALRKGAWTNPQEFGILRLCTLLSSSSQNSREGVYRALQQHLVAQTGALADFKRAISDVLWRGSLAAILFDGLSSAFSSAVETFLEDVEHCPRDLQKIIETPREAAAVAIAADRSLTKRYKKAYVERMIPDYESAMAYYTDLKRMREVEADRPVPRYKHFFSDTFGTLMAAMIIVFPKLGANLGVEGRKRP